MGVVTQMEAGSRFGKLIVQYRAPTERGRAMWCVRCDCGREVVVRGSGLRNGHTASCGCSNGKFGAPRALVPFTPHTRPEMPRGYVRKAAVKARRSEAVRARQALRAARKRREDPKWRLNADVRRRIRGTLIRPDARPGTPLFEMLGYSRADLINHLLITIRPGWTWLDYLSGELELDHIIPLAKFDFTTSGDVAFRAAWSLGNLRLIPAAENRAKGAGWSDDTSADTSGRRDTPLTSGDAADLASNMEIPSAG